MRFPVRSTAGLAAFVAATGFSTLAFGQGAPPPPPSGLPPPVAEPAPAAPATQPGAPGACVPDCRAGFVCANGQCVSACNPPCGANESCTSDARCVPNAAPPPPPPPGYGPPQTGEASWVPPPPGPTSTGVHTHDGLYFRMGIGVGFVASGSLDIDGSSSSVDLSGATLPLELSIGGTVSPGVVIGGGSFGQAIPSLKLSVGGSDFETNAIVSTIGPFVDVYPDPHGGFHLQGGIALALIEADKGSDDIPFPPSAYSGTGFGLMAGAGYEWWVGEQWGVGLLGRLQYAKASLEADDSGYNDVDASVLIPAILFTATLH